MAHEISLANFGGGEGIRDPGLLASALARPKNLFLYSSPGIHEIAAAYTAGIIQNHPFIDGNKRTGFLAGAAFLELNGQRLTASEPDATHIIVGLAAGEVSETELAAWFQNHS